jgi:lysophospholipase L1-like esterase
VPDRYVALGSSFAAGPGIGTRVPGSPRPAGRSTENYAHVLAGRLGLDLHDVTFSGATVAAMVDGGGRGPAQVEAVTADTRLVTVTGGGNDVGYLPRLTFASLPRPVRAMPPVRTRLAEFGRAKDERMTALAGSLDRLTGRIRERAPRAEVYLVDYLSILPPDDSVPLGPLPPEVATWGREVAAQLAGQVRDAAARAGCHSVAASAASRAHHAWSADPWTRRFHYSLRGGAPYHPTREGMRAVAELLATALTRS